MPVPLVCSCKPWQCLRCVVGSHEPSYKGLSWRSHKETLWEEAIWIWRGLEIAMKRGAHVESTLQASLPKHHTFEGSHHSCFSLAITHCKCLRNYREDQQRPHPVEARKQDFKSKEHVLRQFWGFCLFSDWDLTSTSFMVPVGIWMPKLNNLSLWSRAILENNCEGSCYLTWTQGAQKTQRWDEPEEGHLRHSEYLSVLRPEYSTLV